jgi:hypothetical protein
VLGKRTKSHHVARAQHDLAPAIESERAWARLWALLKSGREGSQAGIRGGLRDVRFVPKADISVVSQKPSKEDERSWRIRAVSNTLSRCRACASDSAYPFESASAKPCRAA